MTTVTHKVKISPFIASEADGSGISKPGTNHGYDPELVSELARVGCRGGVITLTSDDAARDLAEWCECLAPALRDNGNTAGMNSLHRLADRLHTMTMRKPEAR